MGLITKSGSAKTFPKQNSVNVCSVNKGHKKLSYLPKQYIMCTKKLDHPAGRALTSDWSVKSFIMRFYEKLSLCEALDGKF